MSFSLTFWLCMIVLVLNLTACLTASFKEDQTKGI